jgi:putative transposase
VGSEGADDEVGESTPSLTLPLFRDKEVIVRIHHQRKSIRWKEHDYGSDGAYFVTICTSLRRSYFGDIANKQVNLSDMGRIADRCWQEIPKHFENVELDEYKVMPNHVHGIVMITNAVGTRHAVSQHPTQTKREFGPLPAKSLHTIIGSYKSAVSKLIHAKGFAFGWQSRFHDHIIRNQKELNNIRQYIDNNPAKWEFDRENPDRLRDLKILNQPAWK